MTVPKHALAAARAVPRKARVAQGFRYIRDFAAHLHKVRCERAERRRHKGDEVRNNIVERLNFILDISQEMRRAARAAAGVNRHDSVICRIAWDGTMKVSGSYARLAKWRNGKGATYYPSTRLLSISAAWAIHWLREKYNVPASLTAIYKAATERPSKVRVKGHIEGDVLTVLPAAAKYIGSARLTLISFIKKHGDIRAFVARHEPRATIWREARIQVLRVVESEHLYIAFARGGARIYAPPKSSAPLPADALIIGCFGVAGEADAEEIVTQIASMRRITII